MSQRPTSRPEGQLRAAWVAQPVLELAGALGETQVARGTVIGRFGAVVHTEFAGFVVVVQPEAAIRMPNGVGLPSYPPERTYQRGETPGVRSAEAGDEATLRQGRLQLEGREIIWEPAQPPTWRAEVATWTDDQLASAADRGNAIVAASGGAADPTEAILHAGGREPAEPAAAARIHDRPDPAAAFRSLGGFTRGDSDGARGLECLQRAAQTLDPDAASESSALLVGRGSGLTPVGDDVLAAAALTVFSLGPALGHATDELEAWLNALLPADVGARTTPISATLLELARRGNAIGPARALLDPRPAPPQVLGAAVRRLGGLGHSTGAAYVNTIGALMAVLATTAATPLEKELIR